MGGDIVIHVLDQEKTEYDIFNANSSILILYSIPADLHLRIQIRVRARTPIALCGVESGRWIDASRKITLCVEYVYLCRLNPAVEFLATRIDAIRGELL